MYRRADADDLGLLIGQIRSHPPLDRDAEQDTARRAKSGDCAARARLAVHNLGLVVSIASKHAGHGHRLDDLVQEGNCGLIAAIDRFDPDRGFRFSTYAIWWIRAYVLRALSRGPGSVTRAARDVSLDEPMALDDETTPLELLADDHELPDETVTRSELSHDVRISLEKVRKRMGQLAWTIVEDRLSSDEPRTLNEIGEENGLSRERIRQIEESTRRFLGGYLAHHREAA